MTYATVADLLDFLDGIPLDTVVVHSANEYDGEEDVLILDDIVLGAT